MPEAANTTGVARREEVLLEEATMAGIKEGVRTEGTVAATEVAIKAEEATRISRHKIPKISRSIKRLIKRCSLLRQCINSSPNINSHTSTRLIRDTAKTTKTMVVLEAGIEGTVVRQEVRTKAEEGVMPTAT